MPEYTTTNHAKRRSFISAFGILSILLGSFLVSCGSAPAPGAQGPAHIFTGTLHLLQLPGPYSLPGQIVLGPDGALWFPAVAYSNFTTSQPSGALGRLSSDGKFQIFPLTTPNTFPLAIAFGHDGKLWFSAFTGNGKLAPNVDQAPRFLAGRYALGQMSPDGKFQMLTLPSTVSAPTTITTSADGALWFVDNGQTPTGTTPASSAKIGRLTPDGTFTEFPLHLRKASDLVRQLIVGADGNLWFSIESELADYSVFGEMGRLTPQGRVTIFDLGKFVSASALTIGPDHNLWFSAGSTIGRLSPQGQLHLFDPSKQVNSLSTGGITTNSDGALWFATTNSAIGRLTTTGTFTFYPFPASASFDNGGSSLDMQNLRGIVAGADGTLWLTNNGQIGHFV